MRSNCWLNGPRVKLPNYPILEDISQTVYMSPKTIKLIAERMLAVVDPKEPKKREWETEDEKDEDLDYEDEDYE